MSKGFYPVWLYSSKMDLIPKEDRFRIIVRPSSPRSEVIGFDADKGAYRVNIKAPPEEGKANLEVMKFFSRLLKKRVEIVSGFTSKQKVLRVI